MKDKKVLEGLEDYIRTEAGLAENSISAYLSDLKKFRTFLAPKKISLLSVDIKDVNRYIRYLKNNSSDATINRNIQAVKRLYEFAWSKSLIKADIATKVVNVKVNRKTLTFLTKREIQKFFSVFDESEPLQLRDKVMAELMYSSGLKVSEVCSLHIDDINLDNMLINIVDDRRERLIPFGETSADLLHEYIKRGRGEITSSTLISNILFIGRKGTYPLSRRSVWRSIRSYSGKAEIGKDVNPQTLRHSFAVHLLQNNADTRTVQELMGYTDMSTTLKYLQAAQ